MNNLGRQYSRSSDGSIYAPAVAQAHGFWTVDAANERRNAILEDIDNAKFS